MYRANQSSQSIKQRGWKQKKKRLTPAQKTEFESHFTIFTDRSFSQPRAQCQYCNDTMVKTPESIEHHLSVCDSIPEGTSFPRPLALRPPQCRQDGKDKKPHYKKSPSRQAQAAELRSYFNIFTDPNFKGKRGQCHYCQKIVGIKAQSIEDHLSTCQKLPMDITFSRAPRRKPIYCRECGSSFPRELKSRHIIECKKTFFYCNTCRKSRLLVAESEAHSQTCELAFKVCWKCNKLQHITDLDSHHKCCPFKKCNHCKMQILDVAAHRSNCKSWTCWKCFSVLVVTDLKEHKRTCPFKVCSKCRKTRIPEGEYEKHYADCQACVCYGCGDHNILDLTEHHRICAYAKCTHCRKSRIPLNDFIAHILSCQEHRKCKGCGKLVKSAEMNRHVKFCYFYYYGVCGKSKISATDIQTHQQSCQKRRCGKCNRYFHLDGPDHVCSHAKCRKCSRQVSIAQLSEHVSKCEAVTCPICRRCILTDSLFRAHQTSCISLYWSKASEVSGLKGPEAYNTSTIPASSSNTPTSNSKYRAPKGMTRHIAPASRV